MTLVVRLQDLLLQDALLKEQCETWAARHTVRTDEDDPFDKIMVA